MPRNNVTTWFYSIAACLYFAASAIAGPDQITVASIRKESASGLTEGKYPFLPMVAEKYEYYEIRGTTEKELDDQVLSNGCRWDDGHHYASVTSWKWKADYRYVRTQRACAAGSLKVYLEIMYRYPRWKPSENASPELVAKWSNYMESLVSHETGHRDVAVGAAKKLMQTIDTLPPSSSCEELDKLITAICRDGMRRLNADEAEYDVVTEHGKKQGANFP